MIFTPLTNAANLLAWTRKLTTTLNQNEARFNLSTYASDAAAGSGGLTTGQFYQSPDGSGGFVFKVKA